MITFSTLTLINVENNDFFKKKKMINKSLFIGFKLFSKNFLKLKCLSRSSFDVDLDRLDATDSILRISFSFHH